MQDEDDGAPPPGDAGNYTIKDHRRHMLAVLQAATTEEGIGTVTADDLLGRAEPGDEKLVALTRNFAQANRHLGVRSSDIDRALSQRRRLARAQARAAALKAAESPQDTETDLYMWVDESLNSWGLTVDGRGRTSHPEINAGSALDCLVILNSQRPKPMQFKDGPIRAAMNRALMVRQLDRLDELRASVSPIALRVPPDDVWLLLADVLRLGMSDESSFTVEEAVMLVRKFIWQVQRKLHGLPVERHTMLVFTGPQGGGKSELVRALVLPLEELSASLDLRTLTDERTAKVFEDCFIGVVDELDKAERANVESLKRVITETKLDRRIMRTNGTATFKQNLTFIGTSNRDVAEAIVDETGNRRFVSVHIIGPDEDRTPAFWDAVNAMDWVALWRSVDPHSGDPSKPMHAKIAAVQRTEKATSNIELWLEHMQEEPDAAIWSGWSRACDLYGSYRAWEEEFAPRAETSFAWWGKAFARMARQGTVAFKQRREPGRGTRGYDFTGEKRTPKKRPFASARPGWI